MPAAQASKTPMILEFKGSMLTLRVLHIYTSDSAALESELENKIRQAPGMFKHAPVVIDLRALQQADESIDIVFLARLLRTHTMTPIGVRGGSEAQNQVALEAGLGLLPETKTERARAKIVAPEAEREKEKRNAAVPTKVITKPVRSGQQVVAPKGNLVVLNMVSPGAEVLAYGDIHVYGALRGRALAGVGGDEQARIFCQHFNAELVAVAGQYQVNEEYDETLIGKPVQVYLENDTLLFEQFGQF